MDIDLGAHLSIARGIPTGMALCRKVGGTNFQFFSRNPRGGAQRRIPDEEIEAGRRARAEYGVRTLIAHLPYTVNLAASDERRWAFACDVLRADLAFSRRAGVDLVVVHPGWRTPGQSPEEGLARAAVAVRSALASCGDPAMPLLIEAMSGQGSSVASGPLEVAALLDACGWHPALGVCLDSCHMFAYGFDLRTPAGVDAAVDAYAAAAGAERIRCLHLNDSATPLGGQLDRHAPVGRGHLGPDGIRAVASHPLLSRLPMCIETHVDRLEDYAFEIEAVRALLGGQTVTRAGARRAR